MIIGHKAQWQYLKNAVRLQRLPHAFLFSGPSQVGKRRVALEMAKLVSCQEAVLEQRPCQQCSACLAVSKGLYPDLILLSPEKKELSISQMRELSRKMSLRAYGSSFKVALIDEAHYMRQEAQNAFLKTLEEPTRKSIFVLITEYPARLLPTIRSRIQPVRFSYVSRHEIEKYLREKGVGERRAKILRYAQGLPGKAIFLLANPALLKEYEEKERALFRLCQEDLALRFQYAKALSELSLAELNLIFQLWLNYFRERLLAEAGAVPASSLARPKKILQTLEKTQLLFKFTNINKKLALENLMLSL